MLNQRIFENVVLGVSGLAALELLFKLSSLVRLN